MRTVRLVAPPLAVVAVAAVVVVLIVTGGGSSKCSASKGAAGATSSHCRKTHDALAAASGAAGASQATGSGGVGSGDPEGSAGRGADGAVGTASGSGGTTAGGSDAGGGRFGGSGLTPPAPKPVAPAPAAPPGARAPEPPSDPNKALASGHLETGTWATASTVPTEMEPEVTAATVTFPVPLPRALPEGAGTYVDAAEAAKPGRARSAQIRAAWGDTGTVAAPTANPGHFCAYAQEEDFSDRDRSGGTPTHDVGGNRVPFVDAEFFAIIEAEGSEGVDPDGARIAFGVPDIRTSEEEAAGAYPHIEARGTWAVAAP